MPDPVVALRSIAHPAISSDPGWATTESMVSSGAVAVMRRISPRLQLTT